MTTAASTASSPPSTATRSGWRSPTASRCAWPRAAIARRIDPDRGARRRPRRRRCRAADELDADGPIPTPVRADGTRGQRRRRRSPSMRRNSSSVSLVAIAVIAIGSRVAFIGHGHPQPQLGLDLQGGASVTLLPESARSSSDALDQVVQIIRNRVDALGVAEPEITPPGRRHRGQPARRARTRTAPSTSSARPASSCSGRCSPAAGQPTARPDQQATTGRRHDHARRDHDDHHRRGHRAGGDARPLRQRRRRRNRRPPTGPASQPPRPRRPRPLPTTAAPGATTTTPPRRPSTRRSTPPDQDLPDSRRSCCRSNREGSACVATCSARPSPPAARHLDAPSAELQNGEWQVDLNAEGRRERHRHVEHMATSCYDGGLQRPATASRATAAWRIMLDGSGAVAAPVPNQSTGVFSDADDQITGGQGNFTRERGRATSPSC